MNEQTQERAEARGVTIDSEQTRDIDDAVWVEREDDGSWNVQVSIADVSEVVRPGSRVDARAREMVATRYYATGNSPMLPRHLSEDQLSLWPWQKKDTVTVEMKLAPDGAVLSTSLSTTTLRSRARVTHDRVPAVLADKEHEGLDSRDGDGVAPEQRKDAQVNHPKHYNSHPAGIECIDIIEHMTHNVGAAIKYLWRAGLKPGEETTKDLAKAAWYVDRERKRIQAMTEKKKSA